MDATQEDRLALRLAFYALFALLGCSCTVISSTYWTTTTVWFGLLVAVVPFVVVGFALADRAVMWSSAGKWTLRGGVGLLIVAFILLLIFDGRTFSLIWLMLLCVLWLAGVLIGLTIMAFGGKWRAITWK
jgi:hypothetical protein